MKIEVDNCKGCILSETLDMTVGYRCKITKNINRKPAITPKDCPAKQGITIITNEYEKGN
jgi:hypothetical protein